MGLLILVTVLWVLCPWAIGYWVREPWLPKAAGMALGAGLLIGLAGFLPLPMPDPIPVDELVNRDTYRLPSTLGYFRQLSVVYLIWAGFLALIGRGLGQSLGAISVGLFWSFHLANGLSYVPRAVYRLQEGRVPGSTLEFTMGFELVGAQLSFLALAVTVLVALWAAWRLISRRAQT